MVGKSVTCWVALSPHRKKKSVCGVSLSILQLLQVPPTVQKTWLEIRYRGLIASRCESEFQTCPGCVFSAFTLLYCTKAGDCKPGKAGGIMDGWTVQHGPWKNPLNFEAHLNQFFNPVPPYGPVAPIDALIAAEFPPIIYWLAQSLLIGHFPRCLCCSRSESYSVFFLVSGL